MTKNDAGSPFRNISYMKSEEVNTFIFILSFLINFCFLDFQFGSMGLCSPLAYYSEYGLTINFFVQITLNWQIFSTDMPFLGKVICFLRLVRCDHEGCLCIVYTVAYPVIIG